MSKLSTFQTIQQDALSRKLTLIDDPFGEYLDVLGCNEYIGWYDGLPGKAYNIKWESTLIF